MDEGGGGDEGGPRRGGWGSGEPAERPASGGVLLYAHPSL